MEMFCFAWGYPFQLDLKGGQKEESRPFRSDRSAIQPPCDPERQPRAAPQAAEGTPGSPADFRLRAKTALRAGANRIRVPTILPSIFRRGALPTKNGAFSAHLAGGPKVSFSTRAHLCFCAVRARCRPAAPCLGAKKTPGLDLASRATYGRALNFWVGLPSGGLESFGGSGCVALPYPSKSPIQPAEDLRWLQATSVGETP